MKVGSAIHVLAFSLLYGASCYQSYSSTVAVITLPFKKFVDLFHKTMYGYYGLQLASTATLLLTAPFPCHRLPMISLGVSAVAATLNATVFFPRTLTATSERDAQAAEEGKSWHDPTISDKLKALNRNFHKTHAQSSSLQFTFISALSVYGMYLVSRMKFV